MVQAELELAMVELELALVELELAPVELALALVELESDQVKLDLALEEVGPKNHDYCDFFCYLTSTYQCTYCIPDNCVPLAPILPQTVLPGTGTGPGRKVGKTGKAPVPGNMVLLCDTIILVISLII